jgi:hypothetical protein
LIEELRAFRHRLANEQYLDVARFAAMLQQVGEALPGDYVTEPSLTSFFIAVLPFGEPCAPPAD